MRPDMQDVNETAVASRDRALEAPDESGLEALVRRIARLNMQAAALAVRLPVKSKG